MQGRQDLENAIAALEAQRGVLGDEVVDTSVASLRRQLDELDAAPAKERRQATVLFADVSGFTAMSERMDMEDVADALEGLWRALDRIVVEHGGIVDKHIGDAVMAIWASDDSREGDPERAIHCALRMQASVDDFAAEVARLAPDAPPPRLRVGINTGPVVLTMVGSRSEFTAIGDTVNTASRIEGVAEGGEVVVSRDTYRHVRGAFDVRPRPAVTVKGKREPLDTYVVLRARPRAFRVHTRGVEGVETRMVGRAGELAHLCAATDATAADGRPRFVLVTGEPGVGKSRLVYEYRNWLDLRDEVVRWFRAAATPDLQSTPYALVRDLLAFRFEIADSDAVDVAQKKLLRGFEDLAGTGSRDDAAVVGHLLGWGFDDDPVVRELAGDQARIADRAVDAVVRMLADAAAERPAVIVLEDLHWADEGSLALVDALASGDVDAPITTVAVTRPHLLARHPELAAGAAASRLDLRPLDEATSRALLGEILQLADEVPTELVELAVQRSGGNPFFLEEIVTMLIDAGAIVAGDEAWRVDAERLDRVRIPTTVAEVVESRIDRLPDEERAVVDAAAVIGTTFWDDAVAAAVGLPEPVVREALASLEAKDIVHAEPASSIAGTTEHRFKHAITRDVTYDTIVKAPRRTYHRAVARWLAERLAAGSAGFEAVVARHHEQGDEPGAAAAWYLRAGVERERRAAFGDAVAALERAVTLGDDACRQAALVVLGRVVAVLGDAKRGQEHLEAAVVAARELGDADALLRALSERIRLALLVVGDVAGAKAWVAEALDALPRARDPMAKVTVLRQLGTIGIVDGDHERAARHLEEAVPLARGAGDDMELAFILNNLAHVRAEQGRYDEALELSREVLALGEAMGNRRVAMAAIAHVGMVELRRGNPRPAWESFTAAQELNRAIGDLEKTTVVANYLGNCAVELADADTAALQYGEALDLAARHGIVPEVTRAVAGLARVADLRGDRPTGVRLARAVLAHPASPWEARVVAEPLVDGAAEPGADDLDTVVAELLSTR